MLSKKILFSFLPLFLIIILAFLLRFTWLDKLPPAIGGDEIVYTLNAKASFITGKDIFGQWAPWKGLIFNYPRGETQAELSYILNSFIIGPLDFSLFNSRLPNLVMGVLLVLFIYLFTKELMGKRIALFAAAISAINPWLIYIGRTAYEATPAMLFYFISFYILVKAKGWRILLSFPFLALAFYSYIATKLIFIPLVFALLVYCFYFINKKKYFKQYLSLFILCSLLVGFFVISLKLNPSTSRTDELLTPFDAAISSEVNQIRKNSMQNPLTPIFVNKYTVFTNILIVKTLKTFSFDYLFAFGDEFYSIWRHGVFYYIDSIFLILGAILLFIRKRALFFLFTSLILIGIIPQIFHTADVGNFIIHATMMLPFLMIIIGLGVSEAFNYFKSKNLKVMSLVLILFVYCFSVANFANIYFFWHPLQGYFDFPIRVVSSYALRAPKDQKITVYSNSSFDFFKKYIFYTNQYNKDTANIIKNNINKSNYSLGNVAFASCNTSLGHEDEKNLIIIDSQCPNPKIPLPNISIARLKDGGESFKIFNDRLCNGIILNRYASNMSISDFSVEALPNEKFCQTFITSL